MAPPTRSATNGLFSIRDSRKSGYISRHEFNEFAVAAMMHNCLTDVPPPRPPAALVMAQRAIAATAGMFGPAPAAPPAAPCRVAAATAARAGPAHRGTTPLAAAAGPRGVLGRESTRHAPAAPGGAAARVPVAALAAAPPWPREAPAPRAPALQAPVSVCLPARAPASSAVGRPSGAAGAAVRPRPAPPGGTSPPARGFREARPQARTLRLSASLPPAAPAPRGAEASCPPAGGPEGPAVAPAGEAGSPSGGEGGACDVSFLAPAPVVYATPAFGTATVACVAGAAAPAPGAAAKSPEAGTPPAATARVILRAPTPSRALPHASSGAGLGGAAASRAAGGTVASA